MTRDPAHALILALALAVVAAMVVAMVWRGT